MIKFLGSRGASAVLGVFMLAAGSSASAQNYSALNVPAAVRSLDVNAAAQPLGTAAYNVARPVVAATNAVATLSGTVLQAQPARSVTVSLTQSIATEAAWLYRAGWPLYALVDRYSAGAPLDEEGNCLATAVYFEARGESLEGQLAVARVVMNRAASDRYPPDYCGVVKQHAQFSFVRHGQFPWINTSSAAWSRAEGVARLAMANVVPSVGSDVLWYHANYVAPSWGHRLDRAETIGAHIFYRA
ncbi:MAG TPA: cell wall hydrolase [Sphingomicrobium sp.]|nr:cell wall hydrolase [Sphingomicrobium sp.]